MPVVFTRFSVAIECEGIVTSTYYDLGAETLAVLPLLHFDAGRNAGTNAPPGVVCRVLVRYSTPRLWIQTAAVKRMVEVEMTHPDHSNACREDCPPGLWAEIYGMIQHPADFIADNPDVYEELKRLWGSMQRKSPHIAGVGSVSPVQGNGDLVVEEVHGIRPPG